MAGDKTSPPTVGGTEKAGKPPKKPGRFPADPEASLSVSKEGLQETKALRAARSEALRRAMGSHESPDREIASGTETSRLEDDEVDDLIARLSDSRLVGFEKFQPVSSKRPSARKDGREEIDDAMSDLISRLFDNVGASLSDLNARATGLLGKLRSTDGGN